MECPPFCPHCGYNLQADAPIERGPWWITVHEVRYNGIRAALSPHECVILHSVAAAAPRPVTNEVLLERCSDTATMASLRCKMHSMRVKLGASFPLENVWGTGYRWIGE